MSIYYIDENGIVRPCGGGDTVETLRAELALEREARAKIVRALRRLADFRWIFPLLVARLAEEDRQALRAALDQGDGNYKNIPLTR